MNNIYQRLKDGDATLAVIGLGYVGLPIALEFSKLIPVLGFDISEDRVEMMKNGIDPSGEIPKEGFEGCNIRFTANVEDMTSASFFVVAVC